ncbi:MAG: DNA-formamidopyrimidine glycosylase [Patescibacteria group bacterium]|nr:DNA-formamidopyrimidine glycosylase [Patescibacteria group bacterium]
MPELPEVTTTTKGLQRILPGLTITDVWTDLASKNQKLKQFKETIKNDVFFKKFKKEVVGAKVLSVTRRAKNILINLSNNKTILIHLKMTGHIMGGRYVYNKKENKWYPDKAERSSLHDPYNRFVHVVFTLSNGKHFVMSDSRKFGKVTILDTRTLDQTIHLKDVGPEPLEKSFTFLKFQERLLLKKNKSIKTVLMDQSVIAGIGNIYSDEMLWLAGIHPESKPVKIPKSCLEILYKNMKEVLKKGIDLGGDSMSDYRNVNGERGKFQNHHNVYRKTGERCSKRGCQGVIIRKVVNGRSAHFCNIHQKLYK